MAKKATYMVGRFKPNGGCLLVPDEPEFCILQSPSGGYHYVCPLFDECPDDNRDNVREKYVHRQGKG